MTSDKVREVPGLLVAAGEGWLANIGLMVWKRGTVTLTKARQELRAEGRKLKRIGRRDFVRLLPEEVETYYCIAAYWDRLFASEFRGALRRG